MSDRLNENRIIGETKLLPIQKVLNVVAEYINHTRFTEGSPEIRRENGSTEVSFKEGILVKDILKLLGENDVNTDISDYGRRLSDLGYLLYQEPAVQASQKAQEFARSIYEVGQAIIPEKKREVSFKEYKISNDSKEYKRELFLWALGKGQYDSSYRKIRKQVPNTATEANTEKERREKIYWDRKDFLLDIFLRKVEEGNLDSENALERTFVSAAEQSLLHILKKAGTSNIVDNLKLPIDYTERGKQTIQDLRANIADIFGNNERNAGKLLNGISRQLGLPVIARDYRKMRFHVDNLLSYISPSYSNREQIAKSLKEIVSGYGSIDIDIVRILENVPGFDKDIAPTFTAVEGLSKTNEWVSMSQINKVKSIWEICQGYKYVGTYSIEKTISVREFECQIISWVAGELMQKYIDGIQLAAVYEYAHTKLAINIDSGIYVFDANLKRSEFFNANSMVTQYPYTYNGREWGLTDDRKLLLEKFFSTGIEDYISTADISGHLSIGNFDKTIILGLLNNIALSFVSDIEIKKSIYRLVLDIDPNNAVNWSNLGVVSKGQEAIACFRTALRINPNYIGAWNNLGTVLEGQEAIACFRTALRINPNYWNAAYNIAKNIAYDMHKYEQEDIDFILNWQGTIPDEYNGSRSFVAFFEMNKGIIRRKYSKPT